MIFLTEDEIADNIVSTMSMISPSGKSDIELLKSISREDMIRFHRGAGMDIRNEYGLWNPECPLTKEWHELRATDSTEYINDGIDCHPKHPDAMSMSILYKVWDKVNES